MVRYIILFTIANLLESESTLVYMEATDQCDGESTIKCTQATILYPLSLLIGTELMSGIFMADGHII